MLHALFNTICPSYRANRGRNHQQRLLPLDFTELDRQIDKIRALRDEYRAANVAHYGEYLAGILND